MCFFIFFNLKMHKGEGVTASWKKKAGISLLKPHLAAFYCTYFSEGVQNKHPSPHPAAPAETNLALQPSLIQREGIIAQNFSQSAFSFHVISHRGAKTGFRPRLRVSGTEAAVMLGEGGGAERPLKASPCRRFSSSHSTDTLRLSTQS